MKLVHVEEPAHTEGGAFRKAEAILSIKPDAILFEFPTEKSYSLSDFNRFEPSKKPKDLIDGVKRAYERASKWYPWLKTEHVVVEAVEKLWNEGVQVYLYEIDAPLELARALGPDFQGGLCNTVWNYLREVYMFRSIRRIEEEMELDDNALVICSDGHWANEFLMTHPSTGQIWEYYFGSCSREEVEAVLVQNKTLLKHWATMSHFR